MSGPEPGVSVLGPGVLGPNVLGSNVLGSNVLGIETAGALSSIALVDGDRVLAEATHLAPRGHVEAIGPLLAAVRPAVDPSRLAAVACGVGPGPYTGLRVGIAAANALGAAWGVPVVGICSLDAVAAAVRPVRPGPVGVALDARRREVYWARYDASGRRTDGPRVGPADRIDVDLRRGAWVGTGASGWPECFQTVLERWSDDPYADQPQARWVARLAQAAIAAGADTGEVRIDLDAHGTDSGSTAAALAGLLLLPPRPLYLRRPDVTIAGGGA